MKRFLLFLLLAPMWVFAQSIETIKTDPQYLWGEGKGETMEEAEQQALNNLVSKISVSVESSFSNVTDKVVNNGHVDATTALNSVIKTYSSATLTNTEELVVSLEPDAHVFRYILRSDVNKIFESRKNKVFDYITLAQKAEGKRQIDDALRYYYWALCMLRSLPDANMVTLPGQTISLMTWIPDQMDEVFTNIKVKKVDEEPELVKLEITYQGQPVASFDYTYYDGRSKTNIYSAADGVGIMELQPGYSTDNLEIWAEYKFANQSKHDNELSKVIEVMKSVPASKKSSIRVEQGPKRGGGGRGGSTISKTEDLPITMVEGSEVVSYEDIMSKVVQAIKAKSYASVSDYFTPEGKDMFEKLLHYGNARILEEPQLNYIKAGKEVICKSIPMSFSFKGNSRKFVENVIFTFDENQKINCVSFGLSKEASTDILKRTDYSEQARIVLTQFLENYKTAFALKRLDYIQSIFDDNAIIITGTVLKKTDYKSKEERTKFLDNPIIKYKQFSKKEYIKHLESCFRSNEYVNIHFSNNDIVRASDEFGEVYGIQIRQDYYSTNYGDSGYLFLYVDLNDPDQPVIKVRTWQPERDPNFGLYGMGDF